MNVATIPDLPIVEKWRNVVKSLLSRLEKGSLVIAVQSDGVDAICNDLHTLPIVQCT